MPYNFVLVHSPLIGPYSWQLVADQLERKGHSTIVPSLLPVLTRTSEFAVAIATIVAGAVEEAGLSGPLVFAGHSAAGAYLPVISSYLNHQILAYIFVDARLPRIDASLTSQDSSGQINPTW